MYCSLFTFHTQTRSIRLASRGKKTFAFPTSSTSPSWLGGEGRWVSHMGNRSHADSHQPPVNSHPSPPPDPPPRTHTHLTRISTRSYSVMHHVNSKLLEVMKTHSHRGFFLGHDTTYIFMQTRHTFSCRFAEYSQSCCLVLQVQSCRCNCHRKTFH